MQNSNEKSKCTNKLKMGYICDCDECISKPQEHEDWCPCKQCAEEYNKKIGFNTFEPQSISLSDLCNNKDFIEGVIKGANEDQRNIHLDNEVKAICCQCKAEFHTWLSDSKECPECGGDVIFFDCLSTKIESEEWESIVISWLNKHKSGGEWVSDYDGEFDLDNCCLDGSFDLRELCEQIVKSQSSKIKQKIVKEIEKKRLDTNPYGFDFSNCSEKRHGYNKGIDDVMNIISNII